MGVMPCHGFDLPGLSEDSPGNSGGIIAGNEPRFGGLTLNFVGKTCQNKIKQGSLRLQVYISILRELLVTLITGFDLEPTSCYSLMMVTPLPTITLFNTY